MGGTYKEETQQYQLIMKEIGHLMNRLNRKKENLHAILTLHTGYAQNQIQPNFFYKPENCTILCTVC